MERIVAGTGAGIAHAINTEILNMTLEAALEAATEGTEASAEPPAQVDRTWTREIEPLRLLQLTTASAILSMLWEARTFVRRLHGINGTSQKREARGKGSKDLTKAPAKVHGITGDRLVESIGRLARSLDSRELSLSQCKEFAELMAVDNEVKVAAESDEADDGRLQTPGMEDDNDSASNPASGGGRNAKRKGSASLGGTPNKKRGRPSLGPRKGNRRSVDDEHWD
jgi:cohesin loading factor subunit SCC2